MSLAQTVSMSKKTIMLVDDDPVILAVMSKFMTLNNYQVVGCENGLMAVGEAMRGKPDLMVLDLMMPSPEPERCEVFDGFSVLRWLQRSNGLRDMPVIVLSAKPVSETKQKSLDAGAVAYFQKPCERQMLLTAISIALESPTDTTTGSRAETPAFSNGSLTDERSRDVDQTPFESRAELRRINRALQMA